MIISQEVQGGGRHGCGRHVGERKEGFIKNDMSRNKNAVRLDLKTLIAFVFLGVAEKDT